MSPGGDSEGLLSFRKNHCRLLYVDGTPNKKILNDNLVDELEDQVRKKVSQHKTESEKIILRS